MRLSALTSRARIAVAAATVAVAASLAAPAEERPRRRLDGATVTTADGRGVVYRQRDRDKMIALARESAALVRELNERFPEMAQRYRAAHQDLTSKESWAGVFGI